MDGNPASSVSTRKGIRVLAAHIPKGLTRVLWPKPSPSHCHSPGVIAIWVQVPKQVRERYALSFAGF